MEKDKKIKCPRCEILMKGRLDELKSYGMCEDCFFECSTGLMELGTDVEIFGTSYNFTQSITHEYTYEHRSNPKHASVS